MTRTRFAALLVLLLALAYLAFWPVPIAPVAWQPPPAPQRQPSPMPPVQRIAEGRIVGPEHLHALDDGRLLTGLEDGRIVRVAPESGAVERVTDTRGRPLAVQQASDGSIYIADAREGLLRFAEGYVHALSLSQGQRPYRSLNGLLLAADEDRLWYTDASWRFDRDQLRYSALDSGAYGRLLEYDIDSDELRLLADGLHFPNGIAAAADERFLLVAETLRYRVLRYWLKGEKAGEIEVFIDNLPGFPDNISRDAEGRYWLALAAPRNRLLDWLLPRPMLRKVVARLPAFLTAPPAPQARLLLVDADGGLLLDLAGEGDAAYAPLTMAVAVGDELYLGSVRQPAIGRLPLAQLPEVEGPP